MDCLLDLLLMKPSAASENFRRAAFRQLEFGEEQSEKAEDLVERFLAAAREDPLLDQKFLRKEVEISEALQRGRPRNRSWKK